MKKQSQAIRESFLFELKLAGVRAPDCGDGMRYKELAFHPLRAWRFDYAWKAELIALEIEGGVRGLSRHFSAQGFQEDQVKYLEADILGWRVVRANYHMLLNGIAVQLLKGAMRSRVSEEEGKQVPQVFKVGRMEAQAARRARAGQLHVSKVRRKRKARQ